MGNKHGFLGSMTTWFLWSEVVCGKDGRMKMINVVPLPIWHKLNYFLFCQKFEKLFIICA
jgi:hypothetical protein